MKLLQALVAALLLAGCSEASSSAQAPAVELVETLAVHEVDDYVTSSSWTCLPVVGSCAGVSGSDTATFEGSTWVAFDIQVVPRDFVVDQVASSVADIQVVALCLGEHATCPQEPLATARGEFPLHLKVDGFSIGDPNLLAFRVEYLGPLPQDGSGSGYRLFGTLTAMATGDDEGDAELESAA